jgi:hypothetical protein
MKKVFTELDIMRLMTKLRSHVVDDTFLYQVDIVKDVSEIRDSVSSSVSIQCYTIGEGLRE